MTLSEPIKTMMSWRTQGFRVVKCTAHARLHAWSVIDTEYNILKRIADDLGWWDTLESGNGDERHCLPSVKVGVRVRFLEVGSSCNIISRDTAVEIKNQYL